MRRTDILAALLALLAAPGAACASGPLGSVRFHNREPVWRVDDRRPIPQPVEREMLRSSHYLNALVRRPIDHGLRTPTPRRAMNVNSLGEVPDSAWFTNRIGMREMTVEQVARGPGVGSGPDTSGSWLVRSVKESGKAIGLVADDPGGDRYIVKFDRVDRPEIETGAEVVAQRLLWAAGYFVPENTVVYLPREQLVVAEGATRKLGTGEKIPLTERDVDEMLRAAHREPDGRLRAVASKLVEGVPIGGYAMEGVRPDDSNDRVSHEHRRDVRAQLTFFAWLCNTDAKEDNTLDVWVEDPAGTGRGHVLHYLLDFSKALGAKGFDGGAPHDGWQPHFHYGYAGASLFTFGLWKRPWEGTPSSGLRGVGRFEADRFDPGRFRISIPYVAYWWADRFDAYWASKILARFRRDHLAAAVAQGRYSSPRTRKYLTDVLVARQHKIVRHWFGRVNPVDHFRVEADDVGWRLCAEDLLIAHGLADAAVPNRYLVMAYDHGGRPLPWARELRPAADGSVCTAGPALPSSHDGYVMVAYRTYRGERELPDVVVHLARHPDTGRPRVIGIDRR